MSREAMIHHTLIANKTHACTHARTHTHTRARTHCGNPLPSGLDEPRRYPGQRPLRGQVVQGKYLPFSAAALYHELSGPGQSGTLGSPGEGGLKDRRRGRRGRNRVGNRRGKEPPISRCYPLTSTRFPIGVSGRSRARPPSQPRRRTAPPRRLPVFPRSGRNLS